jgi:hypothetical protein
VNEPSSADRNTVIMRARYVAAVGLSLFVAAIYCATGPGRIDIIDGQYRFEVAKNIVDDYSIQLRDPFLADAIPGLIGAYSPYGLSGSLTGVPLIALAAAIGDTSLDRQQFFFSFTSGIAGAVTSGLLFLFLTALSVPFHRALFWTIVASFATLAFPVATSTFDQTQHGLFVLGACMLAFISQRRNSLRLAALAGAALAFLVNFQITYLVVLPTIAIAALAPPGAPAPERRRGFDRALVVTFVGMLGLLLWIGINNFRFGTLVAGVQMNVRHPPARGNPLIGLPALLLSPGKSLFLYSPPTAVALFGLINLIRRERRLGQAIIGTCAVHLAMISSLTFFGGDWAWGPRYFAAVLPLVALGFGFVEFKGKAARLAVRTAVTAGFCVQALALTVDHHRFFYARNLPAFFWYRQPGYYFSHSALFARPAEIMDSLRTGVPAEAEDFRPGPYSRLVTYAVFGGWGYPGLPPADWMRHYQVFWLPRPWPLWMLHIPPESRPINLPMGVVAVAAIAVAGFAGIVSANRMTVGEHS